MRMVWAALAMGVVLIGSASAVEYRTPAAKQLFTCTAEGWMRVSAQPPEPCCEGRLRCAQFLATGGVLRAVRDPRT